MAESRGSKVVGGGGAVMLTGCLTLATIHFASWAQKHDGQVTLWMWILLGAAVVLGVIWFWMHGSNKSAVPASSNAVRDISGVQARDNYGHLHVYNNLPLRTDGAAAPTSKKPRANLEALLQDAVYVTEEFTLPETPPREFIYVLPIRNMIPIDGETSKAKSVCASIDFLWEGLKIASVTRAFWLGHDEHEISIEPQMIEKIVLGRYSDGHWFYYNNPQQSKRNFGNDHYYGDRTSDVKDIPLNAGPLLADVRIFNRSMGYQYLRAVVQISPVDDGKAAKIERLA